MTILEYIAETFLTDIETIHKKQSADKQLTQSQVNTLTFCKGEMVCRVLKSLDGTFNEVAFRDKVNQLLKG